MSTLSKSRKVLEFIGILPDDGAGDAYVYGYEDEDLHDLVPVLFLTETDWEDFGKPEKVTVAIEPGDKLNVRPKVEQEKPCKYEGRHSTVCLYQGDMCKICGWTL